MKTCPEQIVHFIHESLDGTIRKEDEQVLNEHLHQCMSCQNLMAELKETILFIEKAEPVAAPNGFVNNVMAQLPKQKSQANIQKWLRKHPLLSAAALFFILMSATLFSNYGNDDQFSFTKQPNLIVEGETVIVPEGQVIQGDIIVKNGELRIEGEVDGNVTVIKGSKYMASTAVVTGTSAEINEVFDWLWFKMKELTNDVFSIFKNDQPVEE